MLTLNKAERVDVEIRDYKTTSCTFDESDDLWCVDIDTKNSDKCPKIGENIFIDGGEYTVAGIQGYGNNFSIKFSDERHNIQRRES